MNADRFIKSFLSLTTVHLTIMKDDQILARGTGFFYDVDGYPYLVTNRHNLTGRHQETDKPLDEDGRIPNSLQIQQPIVTQNGNVFTIDSRQLNTLTLRWNPNAPAWKEHPELGSCADVVAFDFLAADTSFPRPLFCVNTISGLSDLLVEPGHQVSVIGYPYGKSVGGHLPIWVNGTLASEPGFNIDDKPLMYIDCRTNKGSSGSPVFATAPIGLVTTEGEPNFRKQGMSISHENGNVTTTSSFPRYRFLGVYSGRINNEADIGYLWRVQTVDEVCRNPEFVFQRDKLQIDPDFKMDVFPNS